MKVVSDKLKARRLFNVVFSIKERYQEHDKENDYNNLFHGQIRQKGTNFTLFVMHVIHIDLPALRIFLFRPIVWFIDRFSTAVIDVIGFLDHHWRTNSCHSHFGSLHLVKSMVA